MSVNTMMETCLSLMSTTGVKMKKEILLENIDNEEFTDLLCFLLDPAVTTGINTAKLHRFTDIKPEFYPQTLSDLLSYLREHNTGTNADISVCSWFLDEVCDAPQEREFVSKVISKTLKIGVDVKTVNAVYGADFIHVHEVQQGCPRNKLKLKPNERFFLTQKLNGVRGTYVDGKLISRQGTQFKGLEHIEAELALLERCTRQKMVFDGELIREQRTGAEVSDNENFRIGTGIINSDDADKSCIHFHIFDMLPLDEFRNGQSLKNYGDRRDEMDELDLVTNLSMEYVEIVPLLYHGDDIREIDGLLDYADRHGWEGLMLNKDVPYYCKRHTGLIKIKTFMFSDLKVIGYSSGTNKYEHTLGSLIVDYKGNSVAVGSGFTDEQRNELWAKRDELIGKIVEVKYKEESEDKTTGLKSLQFPIFMRIRDDKATESLES